MKCKIETSVYLSKFLNFAIPMVHAFVRVFVTVFCHDFVVS
jgi:hypothetical protein